MLLDEFDVDVVYTVHHNDDYDIKKVDSRVGTVWRVSVPKWQRYIQCAASLLNRLPFEVNLFNNWKMRRIIRGEIDNYDFVFCASLVTAAYIPKSYHGPKFLDMTDSLTMNYDNKLPYIQGLSKFIWRINAGRMRRYEQECVESFTATAYIAERDRDYVVANNPHTHIVPNLVEMPRRFNRVDTDLNEKGKLNILFVGKMDYEPNIRAANFFAKKVFPSVRKRFPNSRFIIAGMSPTKEVKGLVRIHGVEVTGLVDSMDPYFENATLFVAPMLSGSGVQNKILEAMARGCCVLTTPIGAEGLELISDGYAICEPYAEQYIEAVCRLLADNDARHNLAVSAAKLIQTHFGRENVKYKFYSFIQDRDYTLR